ncbi:hypothetical protein HMSSN139_16690 [Paenibacillus sp. HMSSN-139]|nr:hypothetical protein HMSSN139_16690 [Paenibacillus sp. HMSSN-139]
MLCSGISNSASVLPRHLKQLGGDLGDPNIRVIVVGRRHQQIGFLNPCVFQRIDIGRVGFDRKPL